MRQTVTAGKRHCFLNDLIHFSNFRFPHIALGGICVTLCMWYYLGLFAKFLNSPPSPEIWQIDPNGTTNSLPDLSLLVTTTDN